MGDTKNKYLVKKTNKPKPKPKAKPKPVAKSKPKPKPKIVVNKIPKDKDKKNNENPAPKKEKSSENDILAAKSIELLMEIDPNQNMAKNELTAILQERLDNTSNLLQIEIIGYLLDKLENIEEKLEELADDREEYDKNLEITQKKMEKNIFDSRIKLDSGEKPDPAECEQIYKKTKEVYGSQKKYLKPNNNDIKAFRTRNTLRKVDTRIKEQFRL